MGVSTPTYSYACSDGHETDEIRRIADRDNPATCPTCGEVAERVFKAPMISPFRAHYSQTLGRRIGGKQDQIDAINRHHDETGSRLIEVGNERVSVKPERSDVNMREVLAYAEKLQVDRGEKPNA